MATCLFENSVGHEVDPWGTKFYQNIFHILKQFGIENGKIGSNNLQDNFLIEKQDSKKIYFLFQNCLYLDSEMLSHLYV